MMGTDKGNKNRSGKLGETERTSTTFLELQVVLTAGHVQTRGT
jgi:hypothetical protein